MSPGPDELSRNLQRAFRVFADREIAPYANQWDRMEHIPEDLITKLAKEGFLGANIPVKYGGMGWSQLTLSFLYEEIGRACSSVRSLLTVHGALVAETIGRWGAKDQQEYWLPMFAKGEKIAAFGLTEPEAGSDAKNISAEFFWEEDSFVITGVKKWITFGQRADVFLIFARNDTGISSFLVDRDTPGMCVIPITGMMGTRASMLAELRMERCKVPASRLVGQEGWGFTQIAHTALDNGRFSVAAGTLGLLKACLQHTIDYAKTRKASAQLLKDHQLVKAKIAKMVTAVNAGSVLCYEAALLRDSRDENSIFRTIIAKYFISRTAVEIASEAIQVQGAIGLIENNPTQRLYRDAKISAIIEGTNEILQMVIADQVILNPSAVL
jgi:alkylation response protein AidB-like acyl-CoA dehydrogenase